MCCEKISVDVMVGLLKTHFFLRLSPDISLHTHINIVSTRVTVLPYIQHTCVSAAVDARCLQIHTKPLFFSASVTLSFHCRSSTSDRVIYLFIYQSIKVRL